MKAGALSWRSPVPFFNPVTYDTFRGYVRFLGRPSKWACAKLNNQLIKVCIRDQRYQPLEKLGFFARKPRWFVNRHGTEVRTFIPAPNQTRAKIEKSTIFKGSFLGWCGRQDSNLHWLPN
jgi:hypothetical protein